MLEWDHSKDKPSEGISFDVSTPQQNHCAYINKIIIPTNIWRIPNNRCKIGVLEDVIFPVRSARASNRTGQWIIKAVPVCGRETKQRILTKTRSSLILSSPIFSSATGDQPLALPLLSADFSGGDGLVGRAVENWLSAETHQWQHVPYWLPLPPCRLSLQPCFHDETMSGDLKRVILFCKLFSCFECY